MKIIFSILALFSFSVSATEISKEDFIKLLKANENKLLDFQEGMSSKVVSERFSFVTSCDEVGNCTTTKCKDEVTEHRTILAVYNNQYYYHVSQTSKSLTSIQACDHDYKDTFIVMEDIRRKDLSKASFRYLDSIKKIRKNIYEIHSRVWQTSNFLENIYRIDISKSYFYSPLKHTNKSSDGILNKNTVLETYTDPKSFDLYSIKLCFYIPALSNNEWLYKCTRRDDYSSILKK